MNETVDSAVAEMLAVGKVSVKHSCEDEMTLTAAFVLTHHTLPAPKCVNREMCACVDMWKYTN